MLRLESGLCEGAEAPALPLGDHLEGLRLCNKRRLELADTAHEDGCGDRHAALASSTEASPYAPALHQPGHALTPSSSCAIQWFLLRCDHCHKVDSRDSAGYSVSDRRLQLWPLLM